MAKPNFIGTVNQTHPTGRTAYVYDGTDLRPLRANIAGEIIIGANSASISKTIQTELMASSSVSASVIVASSVLSLVGVRQTTIFIDHGRTTEVAFGALGGTNYLIQTSERATGNDTWRTLATYVASSAAASSALSSGAVAAAQTSIVILSGTAFVANDLIMWANTASVANSTEWARVATVTGTASFTLLDPITNAQGSTVVITNQAEHFVTTLDVSAITRVRVVVNNTAGTTAVIRTRIAAITEV